MEFWVWYLLRLNVQGRKEPLFLLKYLATVLATGWQCPLLHNKWSEVSQSCLTLCGPIDCSLPCSSIHGIFQARVLEWIAISFSRGPSRPRDRTQVSCIVGRCFTIWTTRKVLYYIINLVIRHFSTWINPEIKKKTQLSKLAWLVKKTNLFIKMEKASLYVKLWKNTKALVK